VSLERTASQGNSLAAKHIVGFKPQRAEFSAHLRSWIPPRAARAKIGGGLTWFIFWMKYGPAVRELLNGALTQSVA